jgi:hypothetical protein
MTFIFNKDTLYLDLLYKMDVGKKNHEWFYLKTMETSIKDKCSYKDLQTCHQMAMHEHPFKIICALSKE